MAGRVVEGLDEEKWFDLLTAAGFRVAGRDPIATFLTQVGRANEVESVRPRSGLYRRLLEREAVANIVARFCTARR